MKNELYMLLMLPGLIAFFNFNL